MCSYTTFAAKVVLCAHTYGKNGTFTRRVYMGYILTRTPPPFLRRLTVGAAIEKKFFYFSDFVLEFYFFQNIASTRQVFTRYSLSAFIFSRFILVWFWFRIYFISFMIFDSDYNLGFCVFDSIFRLVFTRIKLCRFYALTLRLFISLTLLLVINKHLCLCEFVLCLFWLF